MKRFLELDDPREAFAQLQVRYQRACQKAGEHRKQIRRLQNALDRQRTMADLAWKNYRELRDLPTRLPRVVHECNRWHPLPGAVLLCIVIATIFGAILGGHLH